MQVNFGKTFIVGFEGETLSSLLKEKLLELEPAGVILYDTNLKDTLKVKKLIQDLKDLLGQDLFVCVDQEGGKVQRLRNVSYELPSLLSLGTASRKLNKDNSFLFSNEVLDHYAKALAHQLKELGFNFVFAPCVDLDLEKTNPIINSRSLGDDYRIVAEQAKVIIKSLRAQGIISCAKHFPGHGDSKKDSHHELPVISRTLEEELINLKPFIAAVEAEVDSIMVAHLLLEIVHSSNFDTKLIDESSISKEDLQELSLVSKEKNIATSINKDLVAKELIYLLGFKGLVVSDEITMKALNQYGNYTELSKKLLEAGNHLIIWNTNIDDALETSQKLNSLAQEDYTDLYNNYEKSISKIAQTKTRLENSTDTFYNYDQKYFVDLIKTSFEELDCKPDTKFDKILINKHPKLEREKLETVFANFEIEYLSSINTNIKKQNLLVILFQANLDDLFTIETLKNQNSIFQVSCDVHDMSSQFNIKGAGALHYQALKEFLAI